MIFTGLRNFAGLSVDVLIVRMPHNGLGKFVWDDFQMAVSNSLSPDYGGGALAIGLIGFLVGSIMLAEKFSHTHKTGIFARRTKSVASFLFKYRSWSALISQRPMGRSGLDNVEYKSTRAIVSIIGHSGLV